MKKLFAIVTISFPIMVIAAALAISDPIYIPDSSPRQVGMQPETTFDLFSSFVHILQKSRGLFVAMASEGTDSSDKLVKKPNNEGGSDLDLRYVDWDLVKEGKKAKGDNGNTAVKNGNNGDNGEKNENGEEEGDDKKDGEEKEKDGEGGGWDRLWDASKLG